MISREWHTPYSSGRLGGFVPLLRLKDNFTEVSQIDLKGNRLNPSLGLRLKPVLSFFSLQSIDPAVYLPGHKINLNTLPSMLVTPNMGANLSISFSWCLLHPIHRCYSKTDVFEGISSVLAEDSRCNCYT